MRAKNAPLATQYDENTLTKLKSVLMEILNEIRDVCEENEIPFFLVYGSAIGAVRHQGFIPWDDDLDVGMLRKDYEKFLHIYRKKKDSKYEILSVETTPENCSTVVKIQKKNTTFQSEYAMNLKNTVGISIDIFPFDYVKNEDTSLKKQMLTAIFWGRLLYLKGSPSPYIPYDGWKSTVARIVCGAAHYGLKLFHISSRWMFRKFEQAATCYNKTEHEYVACFIAPVDMVHRWRVDDMFPLQDVTFEHDTFKIPKNNDQMLRDTYGDYMQIPPKEKRVNHKPVKLSFDKCI